MKRTLLIAVLLAIALILSACGYELEAGTIIEKEYRPAYTYTQCTLVGKVVIPQIRTMPGQYRICVQGTDKEGSVITEWWGVDSVEYGRLQVGMEVIREVEGCLNEKP